jgi:hypothetical protein
MRAATRSFDIDAALTVETTCPFSAIRPHCDGGQQGDEEKGLPVYPDNRTSNLALVKRDNRGGCVISDIQMSTRLSQAQRQ